MHSYTIIFVLAFGIISTAYPVTAFPATKKHYLMQRDSDSDTSIGNAQSGAGGQAPGGSVGGGRCQSKSKALLDLFSRKWLAIAIHQRVCVNGLIFLDNAGKGGDASSGFAIGGGDNAQGGRGRTNSKSIGNANSGPGGDASGGSVDGDDGALFNLFSCKFGYQTSFNVLSDDPYRQRRRRG
jgi:hypothetical protein